ncbi:MAG: acyl-CoA dehydratase activase [Bacteroidota bacterium]
MITAGIDIGSRTIKIVLQQEGEIICFLKSENSFNTLNVCDKLLNDLKFDSITATGYGRHLFKDFFKCEVISEIKAFAIGAKALYPGCRTILDIGGQDTKAISLDEGGKIKKFEMNDKCAAGTGRFIEIMAMALRFSLTEFGDKALSAEKSEKINNMCTVFAESEVISLLARGAKRENIARGIHESIVIRTASLIHRIGIENDIVFAGGVAYNKCIKKILEEKLMKPVLVPEEPQSIGALGCAIFGNIKNHI